MTIYSILNGVNRYILNPIIVLFFVIALVVFFWGIFEMIGNAASEDVRERGKKNMLWGLVGMFIMMSVYGIIHILLNTFGIPTPAYLGGVVPN